jgi:hypothetical protein
MDLKFNLQISGWEQNKMLQTAFRYSGREAIGDENSKNELSVGHKSTATRCQPDTDPTLAF